MSKKRIALSVMVSDDDLNCMENALMCTPLCPEHKSQMVEVHLKNPEDMWQHCPKCEKIHNRWHNTTMKLWCRLVDAKLKYGPRKD